MSHAGTMVRGRRLAGWIPVLAFALAAGTTHAGDVQGTQQVMIHVKLVSVDRTAFRKLVGIDWRNPFWTAERGFTDVSGLDALLDGDDARTLARPSRITNSGRGVAFEIGGDPGELQDVGIRLDVVPTVAGDRSTIQLEVVVNVDRLPVPDGQPAIAPRSARNVSEVVNGGSLLIRELFDRQQGGFPLLRDMPGLGWMFRNDAAQDQTELLVLVTPWLVEPDGGGRPAGPRVLPQVRHHPRPDVPAQPKAPSYPHGRSDRVNP